MSKLTTAMGVLPNLAGLAINIGTAIPNLKKPRRVGASSNAASQQVQRAAQGALAAGAGGRGGSSALRFREAQRGAANIVAKGADAVGQAAARDEALYQQQRLQRNARLAQMGNDLTDTIASTTGAFVEARQGLGGAAERPTADITGATEQELATGLGAAPAGIPASVAAPAEAAPEVYGDDYTIDDLQGDQVGVEPYGGEGDLDPGEQGYQYPDTEAGRAMQDAMGQLEEWKNRPIDPLAEQYSGLETYQPTVGSIPQTPYEKMRIANGMTPFPELGLMPEQELQFSQMNLVADEATKLGLSPAVAAVMLRRRLGLGPGVEF